MKSAIVCVNEVRKRLFECDSLRRRINLSQSHLAAKLSSLYDLFRRQLFAEKHTTITLT